MKSSPRGGAVASSGTVELSRAVRLAITPTIAPQIETSLPRHNTFAAWPSMIGLGCFYEIVAVCRGEPDVRSGYMMNISVIDSAVRRHALPLVQQALGLCDQPPTPAVILQRMVQALHNELRESLHRVTWKLSPYHALTMNAHRLDEVLMSQQFEFSASHRLHVPEWSDQRNREVFGKCNNPNSHGHNYRVEVTITLPTQPGPETSSWSLQRLEALVDATIIQRFDHKHLNLDTAEFAQLNPSVENIARVTHNLLQQAMAGAADAGVRLVRVTVWETEKTSCTYPAGC